MAIYLLTLIPLILFFISFRKKSSNPKENTFFDRKFTDTLKGVYMVIVVISHCFVYHEMTGDKAIAFNLIRGVIDQVCVAPFFVFSGYGLMEGFKQNGNEYTKKIFVNHIVKLLIYTVVFLIPYFIRDFVINGFNKPFQFYLLVLIGLRDLGNQHWFIFAIYFCYLITIYTGFFNFKKRHTRPTIVLVSCLLYILVFVLLKFPTHWYDMILAFPIGMYISAYKEQINEFLNNKKKVLIMFIVAAVIYVALTAFYLVWQDNKVAIFRIPKMILFIFGTLCVSKYFTLKSKLFRFIGNNTWPVFILHMLPIRILNNFEMSYSVFYVSAFVSAVVISAAGIGIKILIDMLLPKIFKLIPAIQK